MKRSQRPYSKWTEKLGAVQVATAVEMSFVCSSQSCFVYSAFDELLFLYFH